MTSYFKEYLTQQKNLLETLPIEKVEEVVELFKSALDHDKNIFVFGNGGSAANASHFVTDLGKGSSDSLSKRFSCLSIIQAGSQRSEMTLLTMRSLFVSS
jgi:D-sedoheptulose 7-phosphate isomerase